MRTESWLTGSLRAILAMLCLVLRAFVAARLADICTEAANTFHEVRAACHQARGRSAHRRAGAIQLDAARHHLHILLVQAFRGAMLAGDRAGVTRNDTALILFKRHLQSVIVLTRSFSLERHAEFFRAAAETNGGASASLLSACWTFRLLRFRCFASFDKQLQPIDVNQNRWITQKSRSHLGDVLIKGDFFAKLVYAGV